MFIDNIFTETLIEKKMISMKLFSFNILDLLCDDDERLRSIGVVHEKWGTLHERVMSLIFVCGIHVPINYDDLEKQKHRPKFSQSIKYFIIINQTIYIYLNYINKYTFNIFYQILKKF